MRDFLSYDPAEFDPAKFDQVLSHPDPVKRAQMSVRRELPKRFYNAATAEPRDGGFAVLLDGRQVKTPSRRALVAPTLAAAELIAAEWAAQGERIDPAVMPASRIANSIIDGVADNPEPVAAEIVKYSGTDLICYRADSPARLVERQSAAWDPVLDWVEERLGARFLIGEGVVHVAQEPEALAAVARWLDGADAWRLGCLQVMTTLTGSALLSLMVADAALDPEAAWLAAHIDEDWTVEHWGEDAEATSRRAFRKAEFLAAVTMLRG